MALSRESAIRQYKGLIAKGMDAATGEVESLNCIQKAQEILVEWRLSVLDVKDREIVTDPITEDNWAMQYANFSWRKKLVAPLGELCLCKVYISKKYVDDGKLVDSFLVVGREPSIILFKETMMYLSATTVRLGLEHSKLVHDKSTRVPFERGCGTRLTERVWQMVQQRISDAKKEQATVYVKNALVLFRNESQEIENYMKAKQDNEGIKVKKLKIRVDTRSRASLAGYETGGTVHLEAAPMKKIGN